MSIETVGDDAVRVLRASGELDAVVAPPLLEQVSGWVHGAGAVVVDLTGVTFFDSSGVRLVDRVARECGRAGADFRVVAPAGGTPRRVLEIVGMAELVRDDVAAAIGDQAERKPGSQAGRAVRGGMPGRMAANPLDRPLSA